MQLVPEFQRDLSPPSLGQRPSKTVVGSYQTTKHEAYTLLGLLCNIEWQPVTDFWDSLSVPSTRVKQFQNIGNQLPNEAAHPRKVKISTTLQQKPKILPPPPLFLSHTSQITVIFIHNCNKFIIL
jgi:hypothetical protein